MRKLLISAALATATVAAALPTAATAQPGYGWQNRRGVDRAQIANLIRDRRFAPTVRNVVVEFGNARYQAVMDRYVEKMIDTVNDLDNVLYEVINEASSTTRAWQYHIIDHIHNYEATKPKQHPVGMTAFDDITSDDSQNYNLMASLADWVSFSGRTPPTYMTSLVDAPATKVSLLDTDHTWGVDPAGSD